MNTWLGFLLLFFLSIKGFAFPCFLTLAKDNCWTNYDLSFNLHDANTNKLLFTLELPKGTSWKRQAFTCQLGQRFFYEASFKPVFWQSEAGKTYPSTRYWTLPTTVGAKEVAWNISVCFPGDFSSVPFPPDATTGNCRCNWDNIPPPAQQ